MPIFFTTGSSPGGGSINTAAVIAECWPALNANGPGDAIWWTEDELYQFIDEAAKSLGRRIWLFVEFDADIQTAVDDATYTLPADHVATIQADLNNRILRARNVQDLEALDSAWTTAASGKPFAFLEDTQGLTQLTLYPPPSATYQSLFVGLTHAVVPDEINVGNAFLRAPAVLEDYFAFHAIAAARAKETNASMEEISQWLRGICDQYDQVMRGLWV